MRRQQESEVVTAFNLLNGNHLWRREFPAPRIRLTSPSSFGVGPRATPAAEGGRLFVLGIKGVLLALDTETGRLLWQVQLTPERYPEDGASMSPLVVGDLCIVHLGDEYSIGHVLDPLVDGSGCG